MESVTKRWTQTLFYLFLIISTLFLLHTKTKGVWLSGTGSPTLNQGPGFESRLRQSVSCYGSTVRSWVWSRVKTLGQLSHPSRCRQFSGRGRLLPPIQTPFKKKKKKKILDKIQVGHHKIHLKKSSHLPLRFRSDGTFKILQVADMHFGTGLVTRCRDVLPNEFHYCTDLNTTRFLRRIIQSEKPDFIAFTGDNIFGTSTGDAAESLFHAFGPVMESRLPWAAVLGNHDQESTMTREELMDFISRMDYSVSRTYPSHEDQPGASQKERTHNIDGFGNYNLEVYGAPGSYLANNSVLNLYFLDSGDREVVQGIRTYGYLKDSQLRWLRDVSKGYQGQNDDLEKFVDAVHASNIPAMAFFHIPIPEITQLYYQKIIGQFQEAVACSFVNSGALKTFVSMGDIKAVFMGHDHKNDFCGNLEGIWFCYGGGFGYHGYGYAGWPRRARVIQAELGKSEKSWMGVERIRTWKRLDDWNLSKIDEQVLWELRQSR